MSGREIHGDNDFPSLSAASPSCFAVVGSDLRLRQVSSSFPNLMGECPVGTRLDEILPVFAGVEVTLDEIMKGVLPYWRLTNVAHSREEEGTPHFFNILVLPNRSEGGLFVTIHDVTDEAANARHAVQARNEARL